MGGGQLGLLLSQSLVRLGAEVAIYEPDSEAPACKVTNIVYNNGWTDEAKLAEFFKQCDCVTYEFENVKSDLLFRLENEKPLLPAANVLKITQNRASEKQFLASVKLPHVQFAILPKDDPAKAVAAIQKFGLPCLAKTTFGGYDGKGQYLLASPADLVLFEDGQAARQSEHILEEAIDIALEVSCIVARSRQGEEVVFPIFENQHKEHILDVTLVPARIPPSVQKEIQKISLAAARHLNVLGLLTVEFFLSRQKPRSTTVNFIDGWYILINEFAPRPHNSGHVTMKACDVSQFDLLARMLLDIPLEQPSLVSEEIFCMGNLLGDIWLAQKRQDLELDLSCLANFADVIDVVIYGKTQAKMKRKMGHFICRAADHKEAIETANAFRRCLVNAGKPDQNMHRKRGLN